MFKYVKCCTCGLVYQNPRPIPDGIMNLYPSHYGTTIRDPSEDPETKMNAPVQIVRSRFIERFAPVVPGSIFDIGCGSGFFLKFIQRRGWSISGIEPSSEHVTYATRYLGLQNVYQGMWPLNHKKNREVDVVSLFHVIEHLPSPIQALSAAKEILHPEGIVVLETPNVESRPANFFGRRWVTLDAPRHLNLFSRHTLRYCLAKAGFEMLMLKTFSPSTMEYTESIRYVLQDLGLRRYRNGPGKSTEKEEKETETKGYQRNLFEKSIKKVLHNIEISFFSHC
jgi:2-polyprenyl-3-methyl-5-hydroxy-6-metoxy-1,4-benzoquinol methylase